MKIEEAVELIDALPGDDPESVHTGVDEALFSVAPAEVQRAANRASERVLSQKSWYEGPTGQEGTIVKIEPPMYGLLDVIHKRYRQDEPLYLGIPEIGAKDNRPVFLLGEMAARDWLENTYTAYGHESRHLYEVVEDRNIEERGRVVLIEVELHEPAPYFAPVPRKATEEGPEE